MSYIFSLVISDRLLFFFFPFVPCQIIINCHKIGDDALIKLNKVSIQSFGGICPNSLTKSTFEVHFWEQILGMEMLYNLR
ncbi:hypothetical protein POPTR_001G296450v4 [Populus trichocarpa]|uniref:Uncharacterized protein n=1 Tax=Populus trichocarpa TaxID=3694 RepID=A0ACC0TM07_POPTR|nr:hypothetical protein POPTR_001G296450v4 [Populus trichocarpa]